MATLMDDKRRNKSTNLDDYRLPLVRLCPLAVRVSGLLDDWISATEVLDGVALTGARSNCCGSAPSAVDIAATLSALVSASGSSTAEITTSSNDDFVRRRRNLRFFRSAD